jgi:hypothetical protein
MEAMGVGYSTWNRTPWGMTPSSRSAVNVS